MYTNTQAPLLPYRLASFVTAILGLSNYGPFVSDVAKPSSHDQPQQGSSNSCMAEFGLSNGCHLPSYFANMYNLDAAVRARATAPARPSASSPWPRSTRARRSTSGATSRT